MQGLETKHTIGCRGSVFKLTNEWMTCILRLVSKINLISFCSNSCQKQYLNQLPNKNKHSNFKFKISAQKCRQHIFIPIRLLSVFLIWQECNLKFFIKPSSSKKKTWSLIKSVDYCHRLTWLKLNMFYSESQHSEH